MYSKENKKDDGRQTFYVGQVKNECKKVRGLWNRVANNTKNHPPQVDHVITRAICSPIPKDQETIAARARGEDVKEYFRTPMLYVKII